MLLLRHVYFSRLSNNKLGDFLPNTVTAHLSTNHRRDF
jgi:hypothetical protein